MTRVSGRLARAVVLAAALIAWDPTGAGAHANFVRSDPPPNTTLGEAPEELRIWFSEAIEARFSDVAVLDSAGRRRDPGRRRVPLGDTTALVVAVGSLERGVYTVAWRVLSAVDGHVTAGTFSLLVGVPASSAPSIAPPRELTPQVSGQAAVRWLGLTASGVAFGLPLLWLLVLNPVLGARGMDAAALRAAGRMRRIWMGGWILLVVSTGLSLGQHVASVGPAVGDPVGVALQVLGTTRYGVVWLARTALLVLMGLAWFVLRRDWAAIAAAAGGAGVLLTTSLNSHSAALARPAPFIVDWLHLTAACAWIGGLFGLAVLVPAALPALAPEQRRPLLRAAAARFSAMALGSVAVLVLGGTYLAWLHAGSIGALVRTVYGRTLLGKVAAALLLVLLGAYNLLVVRPALAGDREAGSGMGWGQRLIRVVRFEVALGVLILLATALLTVVPPARQTFDQLVALDPLRIAVRADDLRVDVTVAPARPGPNNITLLLRDRRGPLDETERVDVRATYLDRVIGTAIVATLAHGDGLYLAHDVTMGLPGRWQIDVFVRRPRHDDALASFRLEIFPTGARVETPPGGWGRVPGLLAAGLLALLAAGGTAAYGRWRVDPGRRLLVWAAAAVVTVLGVWLLVAGGRSVRPAAQALENPIAPVPESIAAGEIVYRAHCQVCHGASGAGDGPGAAGLNPPPADFRIHMDAGHTDAQFFRWVSRGIPGTAMPAFEDRLTVEERWHVINFLRAVFTPAEK